MKLLVTDGAGFVGSIVASQLVEAARKVMGINKRTAEAPRRAGDPPELEAIISDAWGWMQDHPGGYE